MLKGIINFLTEKCFNSIEVLLIGYISIFLLFGLYIPCIIAAAALFGYQTYQHRRNK